MNSENAGPPNPLSFTRRDLLGAAALAAATPPSRAADADKPILCLFSKPLSFVPADRLGDAAKEIGFDAIDLAVRPGGHVEPARVRQDLPRAVAAIRNSGVAVPMITTGIIDASTPYAEDVIAAAAALGITRYRFGGFRWADGIPYDRQIDGFSVRSAALANLNRRHSATAMYHTHSGVGLVGASIWDLHEIFRDLDPNSIAINYDVGHATVEGGLGGWIASFHITGTYLRGVAIKDFLWELDARSRWEPAWKPLGQGMVRFPQFFRMLRDARFAGPIQLHFEYPLGGAEDGLKTGLALSNADIFSALRRDLTTARAWLAAP